MPALTFCAEPGHELYELAPLPLDFCWHGHELADPGNVCALINLANEAGEP